MDCIRKITAAAKRNVVTSQNIRSSTQRGQQNDGFVSVGQITNSL